MLYLRKGDITRFSGDVIVNAASRHLHHGGGVCGAIHRAAGPELLAACRSHIRAYGKPRVGTAVLTPPGYLPCRAVIHAVGPRWLFGLWAERQDNLLAQAYLRALTLARDNGFSSMAFPCISTGHYFSGGRNSVTHHHHVSDAHRAGYGCALLLFQQTGRPDLPAHSAGKTSSSLFNG
ncbi:macro domain-containing protein [Salmonella enterica]|nr:macro domain-containing protein [Salmonella enterica]